MKRMEPIVETAHFYCKSQDANPTLIVPISNEWANDGTRKKKNKFEQPKKQKQRSNINGKISYSFLSLPCCDCFHSIIACHIWALFNGRKWQMERIKSVRQIRMKNLGEKVSKHSTWRTRILISICYNGAELTEQTMPNEIAETLWPGIQAFNRYILLHPSDNFQAILSLGRPFAQPHDFSTPFFWRVRS